jgi:diaminopimelate epimerase
VPEIVFSLLVLILKTFFAGENKMKFTKMQGLGNDYIYVNCFEQKVKDPQSLAKQISDRHFGAGSDGLILICPPRNKKADVLMRMFNADGSEAEMCGNGIRCVAKYVYEHKLAKPGGKLEVPGQSTFALSFKVETKKGILKVGFTVDKKDKVESVCVNMGEPVIEAEKIPVKLPLKKVIEQPMQFENRAFIMTCVSMGNPHAVFFKEILDRAELARIGPAIEKHDIFPQKTNVHFVRIDGRNEFTMQSWERGTGLTLACGTGACAACVAAVLGNRCDRVCTANLPGGQLKVAWNQQDNCVYMTGPAVEVFEGDWPDT